MQFISPQVCTILVLNYHHRLAVDDGMPPWFRKVFLQWIPWALRMSRPGNKITRRSIYLQNKVRILFKTDIRICKQVKYYLGCTLFFLDPIFFPFYTGKSVSEAFILASVNPQYDDDNRLFIDLRLLTQKNTNSEHGPVSSMMGFFPINKKSTIYQMGKKINSKCYGKILL